jgi:sensor histidine kinase YesM
MADKRWLYWVLQFLGWGAVLSLGLLSQYLREGRVESVIVQQVVIFLLFAVATTHLYRSLLIRWNWLGQNIQRAIPLIVIGSLGLAIILLLFNFSLDFIYEDKEHVFKASTKEVVFGLINFFILTLIWSIIYFAFHYFDKSRLQEVKNLQLESSQKESELSNLKNQLNPHFMFNAMNSIRALVDEDPVLAKQSITQLSNLLRNTLLLGNKRLVSVTDEIKIVRDYLALEKIRFEERLTFSEDVSKDAKSGIVPPLIIQTLVENAIKHGISKKAAGGEVAIYVSKVENQLCIEVHNDGRYEESNTPEVGIGLQNARQRLFILYGEEAYLEIGNYNNKVVSKIILPYQNELTLRT